MSSTRQGILVLGAKQKRLVPRPPSQSPPGQHFLITGVFKNAVTAALAAAAGAAIAAAATRIRSRQWLRCQWPPRALRRQHRPHGKLPGTRSAVLLLRHRPAPLRRLDYWRRANRAKFEPENLRRPRRWRPWSLWALRLGGLRRRHRGIRRLRHGMLGRLWHGGH